AEKKKIEEAEKLKALGNEKLSSGKTEEAIEFYNRAIELNPNNAVYYANRAAAWTRLGKHQEAIRDCQKSINTDPKYAKAYSRLGLSLFNLGKYKEAIEAYSACLKLEP